MADPTENIIATRERLARLPFALDSKHIALPSGWELKDTELLQAAPYRKKAKVSLADEAGFVDYLKRHGPAEDCTIWCEADYQKGKVAYTAVVNDHRQAPDGQQWRDHTASFAPEQSVEWKRWSESNKKTMSQFEFATFIEDNLADIATVDGFPNGSEMLQMATCLEITHDSKIKSAIRTSSGGVRVEYIEDENAETAKSMEFFNKFTLGMPVFWGGQAYQVEARLKHRLNAGKLTFWYELNRPDKILEDAAKTLTENIAAKTGFPIFHGNPFAK